MFPAFLAMQVDEIHLEMASREFAEIELISRISKTKDVAVGIVDVKSYYIETPEDIAERVKLCLQHAPAAFTRQQDVKRLRSGDYNMWRSLRHCGAFGGGRVAGAHERANVNFG